MAELLGRVVKIESASVADVPGIDALRRAEQEAVGFLPLSRYEEEAMRDRGTLLTVRDNDDLTGFLFWTAGRPIATIQQVVVRQDARRRERATALVEEAVRRMELAGRHGVTCRCRLDLDAVDFWMALRFQPIALEESGRRGSLMRFYREIQPSLLHPCHFVRRSPFSKLAVQRKGFRLVAKP